MFTRNQLIESLESRRLLSFGQPVAEFGAAGLTTMSLGGTASPAAMLVDANGRIIAVSDTAITRYTGAGQPDAAFATGGKLALSGLDVRDAAFDSAGKIVVLASGTSGTLLLRFTSAGKSDKAFGTNGAALVTSKKSFSAQSLAIDSSGRFVVAGNAKTADSKGATAKVYRLNSDGQADTGFDGDGVADVQLATTDLINPTPQDNVFQVRVTSGAKILVLGNTLNYAPGGYDDETQQYFDATYGDSQLVAVQLTDTGAPDGGFGSGGFARDTYNTGHLVTTNQGAALVLSDGSSVLAGVNATNEPVVIARFDAGGHLVREDKVPTFSVLREPTDITELSDGRIVLIGSSTNGSYSNTLVSLDTGGRFGPVIHLTGDDSDPLFSSFSDPQIITVNGDVVAGGSGYYTEYTQKLIKLDAGAATDTPDQFAGGTNNDVAIDSNGAVHMAYYDVTTAHLMYAVRDRLGIWSAPRTIDSNPKTGQFLSIAVDSANQPAIAYYDGTNADLKLAQYSNKKKKWGVTTLDSKGTTGQYTSLTFNDTGGPAIAYYSKTGGDLKYMTYENGAWSREAVDVAGDVGQWASLTFTPNSHRASIAYTDTLGKLNYAVRTKANKWTLTNITTTKGGAAYLDLAYGGYYSRGAISYYASKPADLKLAFYTGKGWALRTLATSGAQGLYTHVYAPYGGDLYVLAYNRSKDRFDVFKTSWDTNTTTATTIQSTYGKNLAIAVGNDDNIIAAAMDSGSSKLHAIDLVLP
jgi:uncharacterized delta-60 repeat protein